MNTEQTANYVRSALASEINAVKNSVEGARNNQLYKSTVALKQLCNSGWSSSFIDEREIENSLITATTLSIAEAQSTIKSAFEKTTGVRNKPNNNEGQAPKPIAPKPIAPKTIEPTVNPSILYKRWQGYSDSATMCSYVVKKKIIPTGLKANGNAAVMPILRFTNESLELEFSSIEYFNCDNKKYKAKSFAKGGLTKGCFWILGNLNQSVDCIYFTEGLADCYSIYQSFDSPVVVNCLSAGNIHNVVEQFRKRLPNTKFVIAGNNDEAGHKADIAGFEFNCEVAYPDKKNDWSDVYLADGEDEVKRQLANLSQPQKPVINAPTPKVKPQIEIANIKTALTTIKNSGDAEIEAIKEWLRTGVLPATLKENITAINAALARQKSGLAIGFDKQLIDANKASFNSTMQFIDDYFNPPADAEVVHYTSKYIPAGIDFGKGNTLCLPPPMGGGKSTFAVGVQKELKEQKPDATIIYLTHLILLALQMSDSTGLGFYQDVKKLPPEEREIAAGQIVTTINSLRKLILEGVVPDLVVIDESESLLGAINGSQLKDKMGAISALYEICRRANKVLVMDAFMGRVTFDALKVMGRKNIKVVTTDAKPWQNVKCNNYGNKGDLIVHATNRLISNSPVAMVCNSKLQADRWFDSLASKLPAGQKGLLITQDTKNLPAQQEAIKDRSLLKNYLLVVFSPTLGFGFDVNDPYFDTVYGIFETGEYYVGTPFACIQQMGRFRKPVMWHTYFANVNKNLNLDTDENSIAQTAKDNLSTDLQFHGGFNFELSPDSFALLRNYALNTQWGNQQRTRYAWSATYTIENKLGIHVNYIPSKNSEQAKELITESKEANLAKKEQHRLDVKAESERIITDNEYQELIEDPTKAAQQPNIKAAYELSTHFNFDLRNDKSELLDAAIDTHELKGIAITVRALEYSGATEDDNRTISYAYCQGRTGRGDFVKDITSNTHCTPFKNVVRNLARNLINLDSDAIGNYTERGLQGVAIDFDSDQYWTNASVKESRLAQYIMGSKGAPHNDKKTGNMQQKYIIDGVRLGITAKQFVANPGKSVAKLFEGMGFEVKEKLVTHHNKLPLPIPPANVQDYTDNEKSEIARIQCAGGFLGGDQVSIFLYRKAINKLLPPENPPSHVSIEFCNKVLDDLHAGKLNGVGQTKLQSFYGIGFKKAKDLQDVLLEIGVAVKNKSGRVKLKTPPPPINADRVYAQITADVCSGSLAEFSVDKLCSEYGLQNNEAKRMRDNLLNDGYLVAKKGAVGINGYKEWRWYIEWNTKTLVTTVPYTRRRAIEKNYLNTEVVGIKKSQVKALEVLTEILDAKRGDLAKSTFTNRRVSKLVEWLYKQPNNTGLSRHAAPILGCGEHEVLSILTELRLFDLGILAFGDTPDALEDWGQISLVV